MFFFITACYENLLHFDIFYFISTTSADTAFEQRITLNILQCVLTDFICLTSQFSHELL